MKVLDVTEFYSQRGGGVRSHLTVKGHVLCQWGHDHLVVAPGPQDDEKRLDEPAGERLTSSSAQSSSRCAADAPPRGSARVIRIGGRALPYDPTYHLLWRVDKVRSMVRRERPDVLEINSPYVAAASALSVPRAHFGVRTLLWHADFIDTYLRVMLADRAASRVVPAPVAARAADVLLEPLWAMVRVIGRGCDATIAGARWQVEKLIAHGVPRVVHVPFGVDKQVFRPEARDEAHRRARLIELGVAPDELARTRLVVAIGRFAWEKRWDVVLDAFARLARDVPARLLCFGDGPERAEMQARAASIGEGDRVRFEGFVKGRAELARTLASADLLLHGCPFETFGLGVAEAVAAGCPVVVPDEGGAAELAFGPSSVTYRALDANACARAAIALLERDPAQVRDAATDARAKVWSVENQFERTLEVYGELLTRRR